LYISWRPLHYTIVTNISVRAKKQQTTGAANNYITAAIQIMIIYHRRLLAARATPALATPAGARQVAHRATRLIQHRIQAGGAIRARRAAGANAHALQHRLQVAHVSIAAT